ncbi:MAG: carbamoyl transferase, partial [Candidatus Omnitrophica bacterium]|nr:carbamoyl transferase [Candidatus Omnitrophota bacterium]
AAITDYLGFRPFFDEWKVMGMSAYGQDDYKEIFNDMVYLKEEGNYELNLKYFSFPTNGQNKWVSDYLLKKLGPRRRYKDKYEQRHFDIAYSLQRVVEKTAVHLARYLSDITRNPNLCLTGGVVLNCLMNRKILEETTFKNFFIQPIANDAGTSMGSALYYYHRFFPSKRDYIFDSVYLGMEFSDEKIEDVLKKRRMNYRKSDDIARETASFIAQGKIVGWFQGRMEAGPRALGNRSIVVDPRKAAMKDKLNSRVKKREFFRPFAPSILEERVFEYFNMPKDQMSPYMILIGDVREDKRNIIPAVTHADGTARVHTVSRKSNLKYWNLIAEFEKITGVPVLLNTSFNENEPIVCTPEDAINCFLRTEFDVLSIGNFVLEKKDNIRNV